jgi:hypothetical protein
MQENIYTIDVVNDRGQFRAIYPEARLVASNKTDTSPAPTKAPHPSEWTSGYRYAPWGIGDSLPIDIRQKIFDTPIAGEVIRRMVGMMYGNGLAYYRNEDLVDGDNKIRRHYDPEIERWLRVNRIRTKWLLPQFIDYRFYMNTFSELIFNRRKDAIVKLYHKTTEFCRLSIVDEEELRSKYMIYSPYFGAGYPPPVTKSVQVPLFDWYNEEEFLEKTPGYKFAYHSKIDTPGTIYYARQFWMGLFKKDGWIDVNNAVPQIINSMMHNQVRLKYQILIPETYFMIRYRDEWAGMGDEERRKIMDDLTDSINNELSGTENAYVSITTYFQEDPHGGTQAGKIQIVAIDDKIKSDSWVPSVEQSNAQIAMGLGLHPSQIGIGKSGSTLTAGSGSDQRESFNTGISLNTFEQDIILELLNFVAQFNAKTYKNWDVTFFIDHTHHTTTNQKESGLQPSSTTIEIE